MSKSINKSHYVYMLSCVNGHLYTGYTVDPDRRLQLHNLGVASKFTRSHRPVTLMHLEKFSNKSKALKRELEIKKMKRQDKLLLCQGRVGSSHLMSLHPKL